MGNFTRRAIAFILGMVVGIVTLFGGMAGAMYWAFKNLTLSKMGAMQEDESGLSDATIEELVALVMLAQADPDSFTIQKLEEQGIDVLKLLGSLGVDFSNADQIDYNKLKDISPLLLFSSEGLNEISFSTVFALLPKGEDGKYPVFSYGARNMLRGYSLGYLLATDETTGQMRLFSELGSLKIGSLFPKTFTETYSEEKSEYIYTAENSALEKVGNLKIALITNNVKEDAVFDLGYELNEGELKEIGDALLVDFLADLISGGDETLKQETKQMLSLFDGTFVKELFIYDEVDGAYVFNEEILFRGLSIGKFMGFTPCSNSASCQIHENGVGCDGGWYVKCSNGGDCAVHGNDGCDGKTNEYKAFSPDDAEGLITKNLINLSIEEILMGGFEITNLVGGIYLGHSLGYKIASRSDITIPSEYCDKNCTVEHSEHKYYWVGENNEFVGALFNEISNIALESAISGGIDLEGIVETSSLGDLLGKYKKDGVWYDDSACTIPTSNASVIDKILLSIYDKNMTDMSNGNLELEDMLEGILLGELMGNTYDNGTWKDGNGTVLTLSALDSELYNIEVAKLISGETDIKGVLDGLKLGSILGKFNKDGTWYDDANFETLTKNETAMDKIMLSIFNKTVNEFANGSLELKDMLKDIKLGELMGNSYENGTWKDKNGATLTISKLDEELYNIEVSKLISGETQLNDVLNGLKLGELLGKFNKNGTWYDDANFETLTKSETAMDKIMLSIYDKSIDDFKTGNLVLEDLLKGIKLGELMGNTYDNGTWKDKNGATLIVSKLDEELYGVEVAKLITGETQLNDVLNDLELGYLLGKYNKDGVWYEDSEYKTKTKAETAMDKIMLAMYDKTMSDIADGNLNLEALLTGIKMGELMGYTVNGSTWLDKNGNEITLSKLNEELYGIEVSKLISGETELNDVLNDLELGYLLGKYKQGEVWYEDSEFNNKAKSETAMDRIMLSMYNKTMSDIADGNLSLETLLSGIKMGELMGYSVNGSTWLDKNGNAVKLSKLDDALYNTEVSKLITGELTFKTVLSGLYVGELMGNYYEDGVWKDENGNTLTLSKLDETLYIVEVSKLLNNEVKFKTVLGDLYVGELMGYSGSKGAWLNGTTPVGNLDMTVADIKLEEIFNGNLNFKAKVNALTLGDVITIDSNTPTILKMLSGSKIGELSTDINKMYLGDVMGYKKCSSNASCLVHSGGVGCTGKWYKNGTIVAGLNAKIADYTFESFAIAGFNTNDFTLGDVITQDSEYGTGSIFGLLDVGHIDGYDDLQGATDLEKRKNIPISQVSVRVKSGVTKATLEQLMGCGVFSLSEEEQNKLTVAFTVAGKGDWKQLSIQNFITSVISMLPGF